LLLPTKDNSFIDQGDALGWNMLALQSMCMLTKAYNDGKLDSDFNLQSNINTLWSNIKTNLIKDSGTVIRHPDSVSGTSISKDHIQMFLTSIAFSKHIGCEPITSDSSAIITKFIDYGISHSWDYGLEGSRAASTTVMVGRNSLKQVAKLLNLSYTDGQLEMRTSVDDLEIATTAADFINYNKTLCRQGYAPSCLRILNSGVYGNHLNFQNTVLMRLAPNVYSVDETAKFLTNLGKVGQNLDFPNWLFLTGYRYFVLSSPTYNDVWEHLDTDYPDSLPTEKVSVGKWGCTNYIYQRTMGEHCNLSNTEYTGIDFLLLFSYINL